MMGHKGGEHDLQTLPKTLMVQLSAWEANEGKRHTRISVPKAPHEAGNFIQLANGGAGVEAHQNSGA